MRLPNLRNYYWAAQLTAIVAWINNDAEKEWVNMEQCSVPNAPLSTLPFMTPQSQKKDENKKISGLSKL